jgi:tRNA(Ile)-lysidine synthase
MTATDLPIRPDELDGLFAALAAGAPQRIALAVSGGSDSTALMVLFADWLAQTGRSPTGTVLTVDHGLRPQSRAEAEAVAAHAERLGFRAVILSWTGPKPTTGVQAAARSARYRLMAGRMRSAGLTHLLTAHTADDQAETLLMRLARGSGLDGLAAMAPLAPLDVAQAPGDQPLLLARPLLRVAKARLRATLEARAIGWVEDPSNSAPVFERTQLRAAAATLGKLGLTGESLGLSAHRLQRARTALERIVGELCASGTLYRADRCGFIAIDSQALRALPLEIVVRVLMKAIAAAGGSAEPIPLAKAETIADSFAATERGGATLSRAAIRWSAKAITVEREPGRNPLPEIALARGEKALWDGRFWVGAGPHLDRPVDVRALADAGLAVLRRHASTPPRISINSSRALPGFWRGADLLAVPALDVWIDPGARAWELTSVFAPLTGHREASSPP